jgi:hypothetical protein
VVAGLAGSLFTGTFGTAAAVTVDFGSTSTASTAEPHSEQKFSVSASLQPHSMQNEFAFGTVTTTGSPQFEQNLSVCSMAVPHLPHFIFSPHLCQVSQQPHQKMDLNSIRASQPVLQQSLAVCPVRLITLTFPQNMIRWG